MYGTLCMHNRSCLDIDYSNNNELCYMMDNSMNCYGCQFVWDSKNCINCYYVSDCIACSECIFCCNLKNQSYCIGNKQYSREEYLKMKEKIIAGSLRAQEENWGKFLLMRDGRRAKYGHILSCENCSGDYQKNSKNCRNCFDVSDSRDLRDVIFAAKSVDCFNSSLLGEGCELIYDSIAILGASRVKFSYWVLNGSEIEYSEQIGNSQNLFGCEGLERKKYCILNKQYSAADYTAMRAKIVGYMKMTGEWGRFFPSELSCFGYNESTGMRYYPLSKGQTLEQGFKWREAGEGKHTAQMAVVPDNIADVKETVTGDLLSCESCQKNFRIVAAEYVFYRKQNIPVPKNCADCRQKTRISLRTPYRIYGRGCIKCKKPIKTTYAPGRPEKVYCEACYLD